MPMEMRGSGIVEKGGNKASYNKELAECFCLSKGSH